MVVKTHRISEEVIRLIAAHIDSVHTLEVLLFLFREPSKAWTVEDVHDRVKSSVSAVQTSLLRLVASGLVQVTGLTETQFHYLAPSPASDTLIRELAQNYAERSAAVIEIIYSKSSRTAHGFPSSPASSS